MSSIPVNYSLLSSYGSTLDSKNHESKDAEEKVFGRQDFKETQNFNSELPDFPYTDLEENRFGLRKINNDELMKRSMGILKKVTALVGNEVEEDARAARCCCLLRPKCLTDSASLAERASKSFYVTRAYVDLNLAEQYLNSIPQDNSQKSLGNRIQAILGKLGSASESLKYVTRIGAGWKWVAGGAFVCSVTTTVYNLWSTSLSYGYQDTKDPSFPDDFNLIRKLDILSSIASLATTVLGTAAVWRIATGPSYMHDSNH